MTISEIIERLRANLEPSGDGYRAWCPDLPGCCAFGKTPTEAMKRLQEMMEEGVEFLRREFPEAYEQLEWLAAHDPPQIH